MKPVNKQLIKQNVSFAFIVLLMLIYSTFSLFAADWPQFRGPNRDGKSAETGLLQSWPEEGPRLIWMNKELGKGFSSASIADGKIYLTGMENKQEFIYALNLDGKLLWKSVYGDVWNKSFSEPRSTPTVDGDKLYVISGLGRIACFDASSGDEVWSRDFFTDFQGEYHRWGIAESPLIIDEKVICTPGGAKATIVALHKMTGDVIWASESTGDKSTYCSPILFSHASNMTILTMVENHFIGVNAENGDIVWKDPYLDYQTKHNAINPNTPLIRDNQVYTTSGYDNGGALFQVSKNGDAVSRLWDDSTLDVHHGGVVELRGYIYGSNWINNSQGNWVCLDWKSGEVKWETEWQTKGSVISAENLLYCYEEKDGHLALVKPSPESFQRISSFQITEGSGPHWAHLSIANGILYVRHGEALMAFDIQVQ